MKYDSHRKNIEPFNIFGERSVIWSIEESRKVAKDNSYYFFVYSVILLGLVFSQMIFAEPIILKIGFSTINFIVIIALGLAVRFKLSRVASILLTVYFGDILLEKLVVLFNGNTGGMVVITMVLFLAAIRSIQATFCFHKYSDQTLN